MVSIARQKTKRDRRGRERQKSEKERHKGLKRDTQRESKGYADGKRRHREIQRQAQVQRERLAR